MSSIAIFLALQTILYGTHPGTPCVNTSGAAPLAVLARHDTVSLQKLNDFNSSIKRQETVKIVARQIDAVFGVNAAIAFQSPRPSGP